MKRFLEIIKYIGVLLCIMLGEGALIGLVIYEFRLPKMTWKPQAYLLGSLYSMFMYRHLLKHHCRGDRRNKVLLVIRIIGVVCTILFVCSVYMEYR